MSKSKDFELQDRLKTSQSPILSSELFHIAMHCWSFWRTLWKRLKHMFSSVWLCQPSCETQDGFGSLIQGQSSIQFDQLVFESDSIIHKWSPIPFSFQFSYGPFVGPTNHSQLILHPVCFLLVHKCSSFCFHIRGKFPWCGSLTNLKLLGQSDRFTSVAPLCLVLIDSQTCTSCLQCGKLPNFETEWFTSAAAPVVSSHPCHSSPSRIISPGKAKHICQPPHKIHHLNLHLQNEHLSSSQTQLPWESSPSQVPISHCSLHYHHQRQYHH